MPVASNQWTMTEMDVTNSSTLYPSLIGGRNSDKIRTGLDAAAAASASAH